MTPKSCIEFEINQPLITLPCPESNDWFAGRFVATMLDILGIPIPARELYEGRSLARAGKGNERLIYLNSMQDFGVIAGSRFNARRSGTG